MQILVIDTLQLLPLPPVERSDLSSCYVLLVKSQPVDSEEMV